MCSPRKIRQRMQKQAQQADPGEKDANNGAFWAINSHQDSNKNVREKVEPHLKSGVSFVDPNLCEGRA